MKILQKLRTTFSGAVPEIVKSFYLRICEKDAQNRALPNFLIIGAQKSGSTSLFNYICQHPQIFGSCPKEIFYFNEFYEKGSLWYRRHFPKLKTLDSCAGITGEASTVYLCSERAPARVAKLLPNIRLIAVLREPAARAISHYKHRCQTGRETRSIDSVFSQETIARWSQGEALLERDSIYFERGLYAGQLENWLQHFPREQLLVVQAEKMFAEPFAVAKDVQTFLGVNPIAPRVTKAFKVSQQKALNPCHIDKLKHAYLPHNEALISLGFGVGSDWV